MFNFGFKRRNTALPRANIVANITNRYPFVDRIGKHDGPAQLRQFAEVTAGTVTLYHPNITGSETIVSSGGTASVSVVAGAIVIGVGTCWEIRDSAGHYWAYCAALSPTSAVMWDVSEKRDHLVAEGLTEAVVTALCSASRDLAVGTDWLDVHGWSGKQNLLKQNRSLATSPWVKSTGVTVSTSNDVNFPALASASLVQTLSIPIAIGDIVRFCVKIKNLISTTQTIRLSIALTSSPWTQVFLSRTITVGDEELIVFEWKSTVAGIVWCSIYNSSIVTSSAFSVVSTSCEILTSGGGLLSFGDSICASSIYEGMASHSIAYTSLYGKSKGAVYVNRGLGGDKLSDITAKFDLYCFYAGTIILEGGLNDIYTASSDPNTSMRTLMENLINKALLKTRNVAVLNINWNDGTPTMQSWINSFNSWLFNKCDELGVLHVDAKSLCTSPDGSQNMDLFIADKTHLSKAGQEVIASYLISHLPYQGDLYTPPTTATIISRGVHPADVAGRSLFGEPLDYIGAKKNNITRLTGTSNTINPTDTYQFADTNWWRVVTGWTAGTSNDFFDADGVPIPFTGQQLIDTGIGPRLYCGSKGVAGYVVDQDAPTNAKIIKILKVPTYIDTLYYSDYQEMDWSANNE